MHLFSLIGGVGHHQGAWRRPGSRAEGATSLDYYGEIAVLAERGTFDALLMADGLSVNGTHLTSGCFP
ncbi:hypothetical protein ACWGJ5_46140, partial [Streptomyces sp. NPDC054783]